MAKKTCFVVMGFGEKTDYQTQRTLDLDKSYKGIIKPAVVEAGLECIRADDIIHSGVIDKPMYENLLEADLVIADLSTANPNAIYELGVRHALRPNTTIIIAESQFKFPFDLGHVVITSYEHLGKGIDFEEVERVKALLRETIEHLVNGETKVDSPVYTFLNGLQEPCMDADLIADMEQGSDIEPQLVEMVAQQGDAATEEILFSTLLEKAQAARENGNFEVAKAIFQRLHELRASDSYITQQLALATYKNGGADNASKIRALYDAKEIVQDQLDPATTNDPETLGLWGAIHKRLWELEKSRADLDTSVWAYERGYYLKRDYYNGINYAFVLNLRALEQDNDDEMVADKVLARRVRKHVSDLAEEALEKLPRIGEEHSVNEKEAYWIAATKLEALYGAGETEQFEKVKAEVFAKAPEEWMVETTNNQLETLKSML